MPDLVPSSIMTTTGYRPPDRDEWLHKVKDLCGEIKTSAMALSTHLWALADLLRYGDEQFGEEASQALDPLVDSFSPATLRQIQWMARIPASNRLEEVPFWHHMPTLSLISEKFTDEERAHGLREQARILATARDENWSRRQITDEVKQGRRRLVFSQRQNQRSLPNSPVSLPGTAPKADQATAYHVVYAAPRWRLSDLDEGDSTDSLKVALDDVEIASNAVCFIWAHPIKVAKALSVMTAWGFTYKTSAVRARELGDYLPGTEGCLWFRPMHEVLLIGVRGLLPPVDPNDIQPSVIASGLDTIVDLIGACFPDEFIYHVKPEGDHEIG